MRSFLTGWYAYYYAIGRNELVQSEQSPEQANDSGEARPAPKKTFKYYSLRGAKVSEGKAPDGKHDA
jgi:hypothetical protein